ncbi:MAG: arsenate reductase ArsC [Deltaproteobacteria bacterium]|nr:arsenate reductase ArsC [Deltaproteobacteria bacterium]
MKPAVLFICLGNSCRSIMAEALARHLLADSLSATSAGLQPLGFVAPETLEVLAELGVSPAGLYSKGLDAVTLPDFRLIINLTEQAVSAYLPSPCRERLLHRPVPDPYRGSLDDYRRARDAIRQLILTEICGLLAIG